MAASISPSWARELDEVDDLTAQLMLELHLQDIESLGSFDSTDDEKAALDIYRQEIQQYRAIRTFEAEETTLAEASAVAAGGGQGEEEKQEGGAASSTHRPNEPLPKFECAVCSDRFDAMHCYPVPCGHHYCDADLEVLFRASMTDQTLYPPRCCRQPIPFDDVRPFLSEGLIRDFEAKKEELDDAKPTYCHVKTCSAYIDQYGKAENVATCPQCAAETCILCHAEAHRGDCAADTAVQETLTLAEREGWRRCPGCERLVELSLGCYHMTCVCRAEFCYLCGVRWKNCTCVQFAEERLLARGQEIADREGRRDVAAVMEDLRRNHDCVVHRWNRVGHGGVCDTCNCHLPNYIFRCSTCRTQTCRRCRFNR